jgi:NHLM bacteriocin system ABC transporter ATP-binding protein
MSDAVRALFESEGVASVVGGNNPFLLDDPASVFLVTAGRLEVFSVASEEAGTEGSRRYFLSVAEGEAAFGLDLAAGDGLGLLAVGFAGTRLLRLPAARLHALGRQIEHAPAVAGMVERWADAVWAGVARGIVPRPRLDAGLGLDGALTVTAGQRVRARKETVWLKVPPGALFLGMEEVAGNGALLPLSSLGWLQAMEPAELSGCAGEVAVQSDGAWHGLTALHEAALRCGSFNTRLATVDELNRQREKVQREQRVRHSALLGLASVVERRELEAPRAEAGADDLLLACRLVGDRLGVSMSAPARREGEADSLDPLADIARASRVRYRRVVLKSDWWRGDAGPLLGARAAGKKPVALLPDGGSGYEVHDPATGDRTRVTPSVAATLAPHAYVFYRPFRDAALQAADVLRFSLRGNFRDVRLLVLVGAAGGLLAMVPPYFSGFVVDDVIPQAARAQLGAILAGLVVIAVCATLFEIVRGICMLRLQSLMSLAVQPAMWHRLLDLPPAFFRQYTAGDLASRVAGIDRMRQVLSGTTLGALMTGIFSFFSFALLFYYSAQLAVVASMLVAVALAATSVSSYLRLQRQRVTTEVEGHISGLVLQILTGMSKVRVSGAEDRVFSEWARLFARQKELVFQGGRIENAMQVFNALFPVACSMSLFWVIQSELAKGEAAAISIGDFVAFNSAFGNFVGSMMGLGASLLSVLAIIPLYERSRPILEAVPEVDGMKADPGELSGQIELSHLTFRYHPGGPTILSDVTITIRPGEFVAIVGPSGSGKSTLLRLLLGLERPEQGAIYYDGKDLATVDVQKLRQRIGVVMQNGRVRAGTIFANIVGSLPLGQEEAWEAARLAGFEEDVRQMPMGMHTVLPPGGGTLSGGQRQRLLIARAIVSRPRIILFDEATSALDNRTQAVVSESLQNLQASRIAIAHRVSTIQGADQIYVLQAGKVVQRGTYAELLNAPGLFADLVRRQVT